MLDIFDPIPTIIMLVGRAAFARSVRCPTPNRRAVVGRAALAVCWGKIPARLYKPQVW